MKDLKLKRESRKALPVNRRRESADTFSGSDNLQSSKTDNFLTIQRKADCACGGGCPACQAKSENLSVSQPTDAVEIEADQMADKVMRAQTAEPVDFSSTENSIQKKESRNDSASVGSSLVGDVINSSSGKSLDEDTRAFMESRFNYDFGNVKIHDDDLAAESANSINAQAYTAGDNVVFNSGQYNPHSESGKHLLAHELTHVVQQNGKVKNKIQRQPQPQPQVPIEVEEQKLRDEFNAIRAAVDVATPKDTAAKEKIKLLVREFQTHFAAYKPARPLFPTSDSPYGDSEHWRYANVYSKSDATTLAARLLLIGLPAESKVMFDFGKPTTTVGVMPLAQTDQMHKEFTKAALERIDLTTPAKSLESLDWLLDSFNYMLNEIKGLDMPKIMDEKAKFPTAFGKAAAEGEMGFWSDYTFYLSLVSHLGKLYGGMQLIIQNKMEKVYSELAATGESVSLPEVELILKTIESKIPKQVKFSRPAPGAESFDPAKASAAMTRSEFTEKGGKHVDFFDKSATAPSVNIEYFDKEQKEGAEKSLPITEIHSIRYKQLDFIKVFYNLDNQGRKIAGTQSPADLMPVSKSFELFSLDDWREYLNNKYEDLVKNQNKNSADAFLTIIRTIQSYMKAFTIHTPYNIEEKGDNYLTKTFPKALTGQLIHDCGVYALKTIYLLSLLATRINLKIQYIMLPNHVGLIIRGDNTPVVFVHNDQFTPVPLSEAQFDSLSKENQRMILSDKQIAGYEEAKKKGDTSGFFFTLDKIKKDWMDFSQAQGLTPQTEHQFMAETAAREFVENVDMPFKIIDVNAADYDPKLTNAKIKENLWAKYQKMTRDTILFNKAATADQSSATYQFNLRYLKLTVDGKEFHNNVLLPFWNFEARLKWQKLAADLARTTKKDAYLALLQSYRDDFVARSAAIERAFEPINQQKEFIHQTVTTNTPAPINTGIERTLRERGRGEGWEAAFRAHRDALDKRIKNLTDGTETLSGGTEIKPAFAEESDMLPYHP